MTLAGLLVAVGGPVRASPDESLQLAIGRSITGNPPRSDIVLVDADGNGGRRVADRVQLYFGPTAWSPDGRAIAFIGRGRALTETVYGDLFILGEAGGTPRRLTHTGRAASPVWSPDGRTIVYAERVQDPRFPSSTTIRAIDAEGGPARPLTAPEPERIDVPSSFSPDGATLAFTRATPTEPQRVARPTTAAVFILDMQSLATRKLVDRAFHAVFSPTGEEIAYVTDRDEHGVLNYRESDDFANELYAMNLATGVERRLTRTRDLSEGSPSWSPDGGLIAYDVESTIPDISVVLTVRADGSCPRRIAFGVYYRAPSWRPGRVLGDEHLRCRPGRKLPLLVPPTGNLSFAAASRSPFALYWVGRRFEQAILTSLSRERTFGPGGRAPTVAFTYSGFTIQLSPTCLRVPAHSREDPARRIRVRGVDGLLFNLGNRLELVTGRTTVAIFADPRHVVRIARALRRFDTSASGRRRDLPPPAPGVLERPRRCR